MQSENGNVETIEGVEPNTGRKLVAAFGSYNDQPTAALFVGDSDEPILLPLDFVEDWGIAVDPPRWKRWMTIAEQLADALRHSAYSSDDERRRFLALATFEDALEDEAMNDR